MKKLLLTTLLTGVLCSACSQLLLEPVAPDSPAVQEGQPLTKAGIEEPKVDYSAIRHYFQTNRRIILMRHVEYRDSMYVQTLTDEDMRNLHITETEKAFGADYVAKLNEMHKDQ